MRETRGRFKPLRHGGPVGELEGAAKRRDGADLHDHHRDAEQVVAPIHNRMPVILPSAHWRAWLGEEPAPAEELQALLQPYPADLMRAYPVDMRVGNVRNNDAALIEPVALAS